MIVAFAFVLVSLLVLAGLFYAARGQNASVANLDDLVGRTRPVDIEAFRNLIDPDEEEFLRDNLLPTEFRVVQRERLRAAVDYVRAASHNAAILLRFGEAARRNEDSRIASAGQQLIDSALRLRLYALLSIPKLYVGIALPGARVSPASLVDSYQRLSSLAGQLVVMEHPARAARLSAAL
jgi:hypothetical protein